MVKPALMLILPFLVLSGCATKVTEYQQTINGSATDFSKISSMKKGKACSSIIGNSDSSLSAAAKNGGISSVKHVEKEMLPLGQHCTVAYGE